MNVNQYDIVLDLLIVNQTSDTLQNVTLELATLGKTNSVTLQLFVCHREQKDEVQRKNAVFFLAIYKQSSVLPVKIH